ncbi:DUF982 domain-containing protein [Arvimicrobium flavum]|uniref:DUF982 domain-containing protein n=1 Tax=Arvimicrobium flavum TaxID=3393320 RepID=UPI00237AA31F|nr:DUF982 domain-containing protein [Mesorhizobium shangrilense]
MQFTKPVTILVGLGFPSSISNVTRAYGLLADWPTSQRGPAHELALSACRAALTGEVDAQVARSAFVDFAREAGILTSEPISLLLASALRNHGDPGALS